MSPGGNPGLRRTRRTAFAEPLPEDRPLEGETLDSAVRQQPFPAIGGGGPVIVEESELEASAGKSSFQRKKTSLMRTSFSETHLCGLDDSPSPPSPMHAPPLRLLSVEEGQQNEDGEMSPLLTLQSGQRGEPPAVGRPPAAKTLNLAELVEKGAL